jgi:hypothetical protein
MKRWSERTYLYDPLSGRAIRIEPRRKMTWARKHRATVIEACLHALFMLAWGWLMAWLLLH